MSKRNFIIYEVATVVTRYEVDVEVPEGMPSEQFVYQMEDTDGWVLGEGRVIEVRPEGREIMDGDTSRMLLEIHHEEE